MTAANPISTVLRPRIVIGLLRWSLWAQRVNCRCDHGIRWYGWIDRAEARRYGREPEESSSNVDYIRRDVDRSVTIDVQGLPERSNSMLANPAGIVVLKAGRTAKAPEEQPVTCTSGTVTVAIFDLAGATVISQGTGTVLEIDLGALQASASGSFAFTPSNVQAHHGPVSVVVGVQAGTLSIGSSTTTSTPVVTTTSTPVVTTTSAPVVTTTSAPVVTTSSAPVVTTTSTPVVTTSSAPVVTTSSAPVVTTSSAPVVTTTSAVLSTTTTVATLCDISMTFASIDRRLDALITQVEGADAAGKIKAMLLHQLNQAKDRKELAAMLFSQGRTARGQIALRQAIRWMISFVYRVGSLGGRRQIAEGTRQVLSEEGKSILEDMHRLPCPPAVPTTSTTTTNSTTSTMAQSPSGVFLDLRTRSGLESALAL